MAKTKARAAPTCCWRPQTEGSLHLPERGNRGSPARRQTASRFVRAVSETTCQTGNPRLRRCGAAALQQRIPAKLGATASKERGDPRVRRMGRLAREV